MNQKQKNMYIIILLIILICIVAVLVLKKRDLEGLAVLNNIPLLYAARRNL